jgi:hypothetical protein
MQLAEKLDWKGLEKQGTRGGAIGCGTALQAER